MRKIDESFLIVSDSCKRIYNKRFEENFYIESQPI